MSFLEELKRRKVIRVAVGYAAASWLILQIADVILGNLSAPDWAFEGILLLVGIGFPVAIALAWAFELKTDSADSAGPRRRHLDVLVALAVILAFGFFAIDSFLDYVATESEMAATESLPSGALPDSFPRTSIAVLAFDNRSTDPEQEFLAEGLAEEILILLNRIPEFDVISRTSSFSFKDSGEDIRTIGQILEVGSVVEGSVQKSGDRIRITVQLADTGDGTAMWSGTYNEILTDTFAIQERVAAEIVGALQVEVGFLPTRGRPTDDAEAYSSFLKARLALDAQRGEEAIELLQQAVGIDPNFAEAYEYLAYSYWQQGGTSVTVAESQRPTYDAAAKSLEINPQLTFSNALHALSDSNADIDGRALELLRTASREQPSNSAPVRTLIYELTLRGYLEEANQMAMQFAENDPLSPVAHYSVGESLVALGESEQALAPLRRSLELDGAFAEWFLPEVHLMRTEDEAAAAIYIQQLEQAGVTNPERIAGLIDSFRDQNASSAALEADSRRFMDSLSESLAEEWKFRFQSWYLLFGFHDIYFDLIDAAGPNENHWSDANLLIWLGTIFRESGFTSHPRFLDVSRKVGNISLWEVRGAPDICERANDEWRCE